MSLPCILLDYPAVWSKSLLRIAHSAILYPAVSGCYDTTKRSGPWAGISSVSNCQDCLRLTISARGFVSFCLRYVCAMKKELSLKQIAAVRCPTCGAGPGEKCEINTGQPRSEPHRERGLIAED
jgi:hypothetical protein